MSNAIEEHYRGLLRQYGDTAKAAQWSSRETQERRFRYLTEVGELSGARVLDFGCGTAHLASYLIGRDIRIDYTGVDIVDDALVLARQKHPQFRFGRYEEFQDDSFDYVFISGVFNNKTTNNRNFYEDWFKRLFGRCTVGLAANMMSSYVDYRDSNLFYEDPERVFTFVKANLTPFVTLRHDYAVKPGVIPFEFIIYAYREAVE